MRPPESRWRAGDARRRQSRGAPQHALVAGDVPRQIEAVTQALPEAGYAATRARSLLEVAERATGRGAQAGRRPVDLILFVLSREGGAYVDLIETLVRQARTAPIVAFTEGAARFVPRLESLGVVVVARLPFASSNAGAQLTPPPGSARATP